MDLLSVEIEAVRNRLKKLISKHKIDKTQNNGIAKKPEVIALDISEAEDQNATISDALERVEKGLESVVADVEMRYKDVDKSVRLCGQFLWDIESSLAESEKLTSSISDLNYKYTTKTKKLREGLNKSKDEYYKSNIDLKNKLKELEDLKIEYNAAKKSVEAIVSEKTG